MINREEKYDRQLRLWANSGQSSLERSHVLVCEPTLSSIELLKNLILPGIGKFTILSQADHLVSESDLAANFYLDDNDFGKDYIGAVTDKLAELNEDVEKGLIQVDNMASWWQTVDKHFWKDYDLVVIPLEYERVMKDLYELKIPTIILNAVGMYGFMRIVTHGYEVVETHPQPLPDLRVLDPWPELKSYCDSIDFHGMDLEGQSRVPYLIIHIKALDHWKREHNGEVPNTGPEKKEFKKLIESWRLEYGQLNIAEAADNSRKVFMDTGIRSNLRDIFSKLLEHESPSTSSRFWIMTRALKQFVDKHNGLLPLKGDLPDMDSSTEQYIALQQVYKDKAEQDLQGYKVELQEVLQENKKKTKSQESVSGSNIDHDDIIDDNVIRSFVKNCNHLLYSSNTYVALDDENYSHVISGNFNESAMVLLAFILIERYLIEHGSFPKMHELLSLVEKSHEYFLSEDNYAALEKVLFEMLRSENVELGNIAAFMGGLGGQEAIKLITNQYIPLDNTLVFDGIRSITERWKVD